MGAATLIGGYSILISIDVRTLPSIIDHSTDIITRRSLLSLDLRQSRKDAFFTQSRDVKIFFQRRRLPRGSRGFREQRRMEEDRIGERERETYDKKIARRKEKTGVRVAPIERK